MGIQDGWLEEDKAYMAAAIDCDGSIYINRLRGTYQLGLNFGQTTIQAVEWMAELWGVQVQTVKRNNPNHATLYFARTNGARTQAILWQIFPYMKIKKEQALTALCFPVGGRNISLPQEELDLRKYLYCEMHKLNGGKKHDH